eukprot:gene17844-18072_t
MQTETTKGTIPTDVFAAVILVNYSQFSETTSFASGRELQVFLNYSADSGLLQESIRLTSLQNSNPDLTWTVVCPNSACDFDHSTTSSGTASGTNGPILQLRCSDLDRSQAWQRYFGCPQSHGTALTPYLLWLLFLLLAWVLVLFWALHFLLVKWLFPTDRDKAVAPLNRVRAKQCVLAVLDLETFACVEFASQTDFWNPILNFVDAALYPLLTIKRTLRRMELTQLATQAVCMGFIFFGLVVTIQNVSTVHPSAPATESSLKIYSLISLYGFSAVILFTKMLSLSVVIGAVEGVATGREWGGSSSRMTHYGKIDFLSEYGGDVSEDVKNESIDPEGESDEEVHSSNSLRTVVPPYSTESMEVCLPEPQPRDGQGAVGRREVIQFKENASVVLTTILLPILTILATALFTMNIAALTLTLDSIFVNSLLLFFVVLSTFTSVSIIGSEHITRASTSSPPDPDPGPGPRQTAARESVDVSCAEAISIEPVESELSPTDQLKEKESSNKTEAGKEADPAEDGPGAAGAAGGGAEAEAAGPGSDLSSIREDSSELSDLSQNYDTVLDLNSPSTPSGGASDEQQGPQGPQGPPRGTEGELRDPSDLQKEDLSPAALEANPSQPNGKALRQSRSRSMNLSSGLKSVVSTFRRQSLSASSAASASTPGHDDSPATSLQGSASSSGTPPRRKPAN